jgi:hypothetical protein
MTELSKNTKVPQSCIAAVSGSIPFFRCPNCGDVIGHQGEPIDINLVKKLSDIELNSLNLLECYGCYVNGQEEKSFIVTEDMARDAGDMSMVGQRWSF